VFERYDFYLYGLLTAIIAAQFLTGLNRPLPTSWRCWSLPQGSSCVRSRWCSAGSRYFGRRYTFIITLTVMGLSTFLVGCLPTYKSVGVAAPAMLVALQQIQGLRR
jgi:MFS family permease